MRSIVFAVVVSLSACAPAAHVVCAAPDAGGGDVGPAGPTSGVVSSLFACNVLAAAYFEAEGLGAYTCPGIPLPPRCPWPTILMGADCPRTLGGECVRAVCDPAAVERCFATAAASNTCEQYLAALAACDAGACL
jgi:hypothetical protein